MPTPNANESEQDYVARCVPVCMKEGLTQDQALGKCYGMYREAKGHAKAKKYQEQQNRRPE
jgi:hypothetical protein